MSREIYACRECGVNHSVVRIYDPKTCTWQRLAVCEVSDKADPARFRQEDERVEIRSRVNS